nr:ATP-binding protein [uncultured Allomuricauda sp.]
MTSYLVLGILALLAGYLIYSEFLAYNEIQSSSKDNQKLLQTNLLLTELHEAENLSKLALQTRRSNTLKKYAKKVDSIILVVDSLKVLAEDKQQSQRLDTVEQLLKEKAYNTAELRKIRLKTAQYAPIDSLLNTIQKMEVDMGRITPENLVANFDELPSAAKKSINEYVALLNKNIPKDPNSSEKTLNVDSLLALSKTLLTRSKKENAQLKQSLIQKELDIYRTDMELSRKLRSILARLQLEINANAEFEGFQKQKMIERSIRFGGMAAILGIVMVILFTILVSKDFLRVQRYREQLESEKSYSESLLKSREQLISTVSHDLKSPLGTIRGYTELLEQKLIKDKSSGYVQNIRSATAYIDTLVSDLLDFSRLEAGKLSLEKKAFSLPKLMNSLTSQYKDVQNKKELSFSCAIASELQTPIVSDPIRLSQILNNLIGNAFKYTEKGFVAVDATVSQTVAGPYLKIRVKDSGIGIKKEKQILIFKEFTQADTSIQHTYGGYGLGLTIAKKLCGLLGGYLELESMENVGSTFTISFPLVFGKMIASYSENETIEEQQPVSLLVLDDDTSFLKLVLEICNVHHIKASGFTKFEDLEKVPHLNYNLVLTDINMPKVDGFDVVRRLRTKDYGHYRGQPVIAMTGQSPIDKTEYLKAGFSEVLQKPFSPTVLLQTLYSILASEKSGYPNTSKTEIEGLSQPLFDIRSISSFLEDTEAVKNVLSVFLENTVHNLDVLDQAIRKRNVKKIESVSHQMLPMFRQLRIEKVIPTLENWEVISKNVQWPRVEKEYQTLKNLIPKLKMAISEYLTKHPVDID